MKKLLITVLISLTFFTDVYSQAVEDSNAYQIIYEADKDGNRISGSLEDLVTYVQNGNPIRVGWELNLKLDGKTYIMSHWTDAGFITVLQGHVFAQIKSIYGQGFGRPAEKTKPAMYLNNAEPNGWVALIGTTGVMRTKSKRDEEMITYLKKTMNDKEIDEFLKRDEVKNTRTKWAVSKK